MTDLNPKRTILILKGTHPPMEATESFLKNRDWSVFSTTDIKEAITYVAEKKPVYILISIDHPHPKITMLPQIFKQACGAVIIAFAESTSTYSEGILVGLTAADHRVFAPATGPAVERCINKHLLEKNKRLKDPISEESVPTSPSIPNWIPLQNNFDSFPAAEKHNDSFIAACVKQAFSEVCLLPENTLNEINKILKAKSATCFIVESAQYSGYLLAAQAGATYPDKKFAWKFQNNLMASLKAKGAPTTENENIDVVLQDVEFKQLADHSAEFSEKSVYLGNEVAIAFFPRKEVKVKIEKSEIENMVKIKMEDLIGDRVVDFDIFIYLQTNNKIILCTGKGNVFCEKQRLRFIEQGRTYLHVQMDDIKSVSKYYVESYLNKLAVAISKK